MNTRDLQRALAAAGFDPGPVDGMPGPRTRRATRAFQRARGLVADGIAGPLTQAALLRGGGEVSAAPAGPWADVPADLPWLAEAARLRGLAEVPGPGDNPQIMGWARGLGLGVYTGDDLAWCGLFVAHCIRAGLPEAPLPSGLLSARAWGAFGREVAPQVGAVLVFWRGSRSGWQGHVGFCWAEDDSHFHVLGGNQSDAVTVTRIARDRLLQARWPGERPDPGIVRLATPWGLPVGAREA